METPSEERVKRTFKRVMLRNENTLSLAAVGTALAGTVFLTLFKSKGGNDELPRHG